MDGSRTGAKRGYDGVLFDLDGTLWDAIDSTVVAWNNVASRYRLRAEPLTRRDLERVTGAPIEHCVDVLFGTAVTDPAALIDDIALEEARVIADRGALIYPGVIDGLRTLAADQLLFIVSNCQAWYLERFLSMSGLGNWLRDYDCHGSSGMPKGAMIRRLCDRHGVRSALYVGDTTGDEEAARVAGVDFCHAAYGFGTAQRPVFSIGDFDGLLSRLA